MSTFKILFIAAKSSLPREGEKNPEILFSFWVHERPSYLQFALLPQPDLGHSMNERFVGICLMQAKCLGKPHTTVSVSQPAEKASQGLQVPVLQAWALAEDYNLNQLVLTFLSVKKRPVIRSACMCACDGLAFVENLLWAENCTYEIYKLMSAYWSLYLIDRYQFIYLYLLICTIYR